MMTKLKAVVAAIGGLATVTTGVLADNVIGLDEWGTLAAGLGVAAASVYAVWRTPNAPAE